MPRNGYQPIGTERVEARDGYVYVKIAERKIDPKSAHDNWKPKHHLVWEQHNGPIPPSTQIVFADHDKRNFDPCNLVAVPRNLWATISRDGISYCDAESLRTAMNIAKLKNIKSEIQKKPRPCVKCGCEFKPRFARQRKCDECIKIYGIGRK